MRHDRGPAAQRFKHPIGPQVHEILWREWDPIGLNAWGADDEYDSYVSSVISKVLQGASADDIADYLDWASNERIGCPRPREFNLRIAEKLVALRPEAN